MKDGFTGEGKVLPPAIKAEYDREYERWSEYFLPVNIEEVSLVKIIALSQSRVIPMMDEIERLEEQNRRYELDCGDGDRRADVQRWYKRMPDDPGLSVSEMTRTSIGCRWLADRWAAFENGLAKGACRWRDDDLKRLFNLIGIPEDERHLNADIQEIEDLYKKAKAGDASAHASLLERVTTYRRMLIDEAERLESGHEAFKRDMLESKRHVDLSPAMMRLRRLESANLRMLTRCLDQMRKLRAPAAVPVASVVPKPEPPRPEPPKPQPPAAKHVEPPTKSLARDPRLQGSGGQSFPWDYLQFERDEIRKSLGLEGVHMDIVAAAPGTRG